MTAMTIKLTRQDIERLIKSDFEERGYKVNSVNFFIGSEEQGGDPRAGQRWHETVLKGATILASRED